MEATPRFELGVELLQSSALPLGYVALWIKGKSNLPFIIFGAGDEARTRYLHLGKVALYQMSYTCMSWSILCGPHTHETRNFKGYLPANMSDIFAGRMVPPAGIEPATRGFSVPCSTN